MVASAHRLRSLGLSILIAGSYGVFAVATPTFALQHGIVSLSWPSSGIALASLLIFGQRYWPAIFVGAYSGLLLNSHGIFLSAISAAGLTLEPMIGAWLIRKRCNFDLNLGTYRSYLCLMICGATLSPLASTLFDTIASVISDAPITGSWPVRLFQSWMDNATGIMMVTPTILVWRRFPWGWLSNYWRSLEVATILCLHFIVGQIVFMDWFHGSFGTINRGYWLYFFITWAAIRLGAHGVILFLWLAAWQGLHGAISGTGFFARDIAATQLSNFWFYTAIISTVGMSIATILAERRRSEHAFRDSSQRYDEMARRIPVGTYTIRARSNGTLAFDYVSPRLCELLGIKAEALLRDAGVAYRTAHPDDFERLILDSDSAVANRRPLRWEGRMIVRGEARWFRIESDPTPLPSGECLWNGVISDITERKQLDADLLRTKEEAESARQRAEAILSLAGQGICGIDLHGKLTFVNSTATELLGWSAQEMLGRHQHDLFHHSRADGTHYRSDDCPIYRTLQNTTRHHARDEVFWRKDGSNFPVEGRASFFL